MIEQLDNDNSSDNLCQAIPPQGPAIHDNSLQLTLLELGLVNYVKIKPITESICFYLQAISHQGIDYVAKSGASFPWEKK